MEHIVFAYIPVPSQEFAVALSQKLVRAKLVACTNYFEINNCYWWDHNVTHEDEYILIAKTLPEYAEKVEAFVKSAHSYKTPCIAMVDVRVNVEYFQWMQETLTRE